MKYRFKVILVLVFSLLLFGCVAGTTTGPISKGEVNPELGESKWRLVSFQSMNDSIGTIKPEDNQTYLMHLKKDGSVLMRVNCNRAMGSWSAKPAKDAQSGSFSFGPLSSTRMLCSPPSMDGKILKDSAYVRSYLLKDGKLHLSLMADGGIYTWEKVTAESLAAKVPLAPGDGGPRNWEVRAGAGEAKLREQPDINARVILTYKVGTILDNLGCRSDGEQAWCDVQQLGGGARGFVAAKYLLPAVSPDGSVSVGPDDSALRAGEGKFEASGKIPCALAAGQPITRCDMRVARAGGGYATVVVTKPGGRTRAIFFRMGRPVGADTSQADGYPAFHASKEADLNLIKIGPERYEIPDAVVLGG